MRRVGGKRRKGSEWWNEEVGRAVAEKRRAFEEWLQRRDRVTYDRCRAQRAAVKLAVQAAKRMAIPGASHNFTLTYIHSQLSSFAYSAKLTHQSTQLLL